MPISALDPNTALLIIDLQKGIVSLPTFTHTDLERYLKHHRVTQVVIAGVATSAGVESTARHAHELGFNVALAVDAMTDTRPDAHLNSVTQIFPRLGETGTTQEIIDLIAGRST